ncbi:MAG: site-specific integrase, partial [Methanomassiliicoccales archaeon]|nr:site-specific integrase [Methanomassiliicoccales archaeon]
YREGVLSYLRSRDELLSFYGRTSATYLIPNLRGGGDAPYSANHFRELKEEVKEISGVDFKLKDLRPTFATLSVEKDPNLLVDVSAQLGHSNLMTTQRYYAQISAESAGARLEKAWAIGKVPEAKGKGATADAVTLLLKALGIDSVEELQERLSTQVKKAENARIEYQNQLTGYN